MIAQLSRYDSITMDDCVTDLDETEYIALLESPIAHMSRLLFLVHITMKDG